MSASSQALNGCGTPPIKMVVRVQWLSVVYDAAAVRELPGTNPEFHGELIHHVELPLLTIVQIIINVQMVKMMQCI